MNDLEHPDITAAMRTGYPTWKQPEIPYCDLCGVRLDNEEVYADRIHDWLCKDCLLTLHEKRNWW